jgi:hypothetical protein
MCLCNRRSFTAGTVCLCLILTPIGAKNAPASSLGHVLTAATSTGSLTSASIYSTPSMVTGAVYPLPVELPRPAAYEPDRRWRYT